uniref:Uncharacterized protein n=1 Tax=Brassica campestris TaxID=3711 RepID=A0A3P5ZUQ7_BRACM|nr:unnamed protein product [Brassica rapa]
MVITSTFLSYSICLRYIIQTSWLFLEMRHMKLVFFYNRPEEHFNQ